MLSSFFRISPFWGPTPFRYSIGLDNMGARPEIAESFYKYRFSATDLLLGIDGKSNILYFRTKSKYFS